MRIKTVPVWSNRLTVTTGGGWHPDTHIKVKGQFGELILFQPYFEAESSVTELLPCTLNLSSITAMMEAEICTTALRVLCGCQEQTSVIRHTAITLPTEPSPQASTLFF